jgi:hypothetical protein
MHMENLIGLAITVMVAVILAWTVAFPIYNSAVTLATQNNSAIGPSNASSPGWAGTSNLTPMNGVLSTTIPLMTIVVIIVFLARNMMG